MKPQAPTPVPPPDLERRVIARLREAGLIRNDTWENDMKKVHLSWASAAAVLLVVGVFLGRMPLADDRRAAEPEDARAQYALFLYEDAAYSVPQQMDERVAEYSAWARGLATDGTLVAGEKLADSGLVLHAGSASTEHVPQSDAGSLAGYFVIRASDQEEAVRIARTCPHLKYGGRISLRRIDS